MTGVLHTARISTIKVIVSAIRYIIIYCCSRREFCEIAMGFPFPLPESFSCTVSSVGTVMQEKTSDTRVSWA